MLFNWINNLYNYFTNNVSDREKKINREKKIRASLEIGKYDKDLVNLIVNLKSVNHK